MIMYACYHRAGSTETGGTLGLVASQPSLLGLFPGQWKTMYQKKTSKNKTEKIQPTKKKKISSVAGFPQTFSHSDIHYRCVGTLISIRNTIYTLIHLLASVKINF